MSSIDSVYTFWQAAIEPATGCPHYITAEQAGRFEPGEPSMCEPCLLRPVIPAQRNRKRGAGKRARAAV